VNEQLAEILCNTLENMKRYSYRDIATIAISLAKIMKQVESRGQRDAAGSLHQTLHDLLIGGGNSESKRFIFREISMQAIPILSKFEARSLSNLIYSFGLAECAPKIENDRTVLDILVLEAISKLHHFNSQNLSNMLWSYAKMKSPNLVLFKALGDLIVGMNDLSGFNSQDISNIVWSYTTAGEAHPQLYSKFSDHVIAMKDLGQFKPQHLSNIIWAYATAGESHPQLYKKIGDHIVAMKVLGQFKPQDLSNIVWSHATAGEAHLLLFSKFADHIVAMKDLRQFIPQDFSNIVWSYATAGHLHPLLFQKVALVAISRHNEYNSQSIANLLWAYATVGIIDQHLFTSFAPVVKSVLSQCSSQALANIAWAYAVANVNDPFLFNTDFVAALQARAVDFVLVECRQLHQWQLWQNELKSGINLPPAPRKKCHQAFDLRLPQPSNLQDDVISVLSSIGMSPEEEVLTLSGYRLDALVEVNGIKVGIEVDGPYHFMNREPTGSTLLKRRQVNNLDGIKIVSVPYWEWDKLGKDRAKKQDYLHSKLDLNNISIISVPDCDWIEVRKGRATKQR
jgi:hypothetical protein